MTSLQNKRIDWLIILERWSDVTLLWKRRGKSKKFKPEVARIQVDVNQNNTFIRYIL